jgi:Concanavalin A-like lectin/glucanases superfamily
MLRSPYGASYGGEGGAVSSTASLNGNLISFWKLDDTSDAIGTNTLTNNNSVTFVAGQIGNAAHFIAANSQRLTVANNASLQVGGVDFSLSFWITSDFASVYVPVARLLNGGSSGDYYCYVNNPGIPHFGIWDGNGNSGLDLVGTGLTANVYHHIVLTYVNATQTASIYVDNGSPVTGVSSVNTTNSVTEFSLGGFSGGGDYLNGDMDCVGFWQGRALVAADVAALWNGGLGLEPPF